jgi:hypothetical protein
MNTLSPPAKSTGREFRTHHRHVSGVLTMAAAACRSGIQRQPTGGALPSGDTVVAAL